MMDSMGHGFMWLWWVLLAVFLIAGSLAFIRYLMK